MAPTVYLETTIPSYLAAHPSRDLVIAAHQQLTHEWWNLHRRHFELYISQIVLDEISAGDPEAAARRLALVDQIPLIDPPDDSVDLVRSLLDEVPLPLKAANDALHIAIATGNGIRYLLTWNCTHIANAALRGGIESVCESRGYEAPVICTPEQLMKETQ